MKPTIESTKGLIMSGPLAVEAHFGRKTVTRRLIKGITPGQTIYNNGTDNRGAWWMFNPEEEGDCPIVRPKYNVGDWCYIREPFTARAFANDVDHKGGRLNLDQAFWQDIPSALRKPGAINWVCYRGDMSFWYPVEREDEASRKLYPLESLVQCDPRTDEITAFDGHRWYAGRFMPKWMGRTLVRIVDVSAEHVQQIDEADAIMEGFPIGQPIEPTTAKADFYRLWNEMHGDGEHGIAENPWVWRYEFQVHQVEPHAHWEDTNPGGRYDHDKFMNDQMDF
jgi:hypothetical protein